MSARHRFFSGMRYTRSGRDEHRTLVEAGLISIRHDSETRLRGVHMSYNKIQRRDFLKGATGVCASVIAIPQIVPSSVFGADGTPAPSERIGLGVIGLGIQGTGNMRAFLGNKEVRVAAVCDVHQTRRQV